MEKQIKDFIDKFQKLEKLLKQMTNSRDETNFREALRSAAQQNSFVAKNVFLLEDLYALRNVFVHRERGKYVATIQQFVIGELETVIENVEKPPPIRAKFTVSVFQTKGDDSIFHIMNTMIEKTFTHVPVWVSGRFIGVFSYTSFFHWLADQQQKTSHEVTFTKKFFDDINLKYLNSPIVNYSFVAESLSLFEVKPIFEKALGQKKRLDCLLITPSGKKGEQITGIITAWDLGSI